MLFPKAFLIYVKECAFNFLLAFLMNNLYNEKVVSWTTVSDV